MQIEYKEVGGVRLAQSHVLDNEILVLNGAGVRSLLMVKIYVAALYVHKSASNAEDIIHSKQSRRVELIMKRSVDANMILDSFHSALKQNLSREIYQHFQPRFNELDSTIQNIKNTKEGDRLALDFSNHGDSRITFNGEQLATIHGEDFAQSLLKIWLGSKPVQDNLKKALLGG